MGVFADHSEAGTEDLPDACPAVIPLENIFSVLQTREFREDKYYLSQMRGYDVGAGFTWQHWIDSGHAQRFREAFDRSAKNLRRACEQYCGQVCGVYEQHNALGRKNGISEDEISACPMPSDLLHLLLENRPV